MCLPMPPSGPEAKFFFYIMFSMITSFELVILKTLVVDVLKNCANFRIICIKLSIYVLKTGWTCAYM